MESMTTIEMLQARNRQLAGRIAELEEELRQVRELLTCSAPLPAWLPHLTPKEEMTLRHIMSRDMATHDGLRYVLHQGDERHEHIVHVYMFKLRRKLAPFGIVIENLPARGYRMRRPFRELLSDPLSSPPVSSARHNDEANDDNDGNSPAGAGLHLAATG